MLKRYFGQKFVNFVKKLERCCETGSGSNPSKLPEPEPDLDKLLTNFLLEIFVLKYVLKN
jgi:hypothetical protein